MKRMVKALHDVNNCMVYTSVPVGLCGMCLSYGMSTVLLLRGKALGRVSRAHSTEQYAYRGWREGNMGY